MRYVHLMICLTFAGLAHSQLANVNSGIGDLSLRLLQKTVANGRNTIHSAYSISSALGMCLLGARGTTSIAMSDTMGFTGMTEDNIMAGFKESTEKLALVQSEPGKGFVVNKANQIYVSESYQIGVTYREKVNAVFRANVKTVDFNDDIAVQKDINGFVKNHTRNLIPQILDSPLNKATVMALVNALYFKGPWRTTMKNSISTKQFNSPYCSVSSSQRSKWIEAQAQFNYAVSPELEATLIELPYVGNSNSRDQASMIIILPNKMHNCNSSRWVQNVLTWDRIDKAVISMQSTLVHVIIPRMKIEAGFELAEVLNELGMSEAFSDSANFNGMVNTGNAGIKIDKVIHKAKMSVDEKGTEAAAATVVVKALSKAIRFNPVEPVEMFVDRSFAAFIVMQQSSSVVPLFSAVINEV